MTPEAIQACLYALEVNGDRVAIEIPAAEYRRLLDRAAEANRLERELAKWQQAARDAQTYSPSEDDVDEEDDASNYHIDVYLDGWSDAISDIYRRVKQEPQA